MSITLTNCGALEVKIEKAIKQSPYDLTKEQFCKSVLENAIKDMVRNKLIKL